MNGFYRTIWLVTGLLWAARSLLEFAQPVYWDPVTAIDWTAVWLGSACWLLLAPSVILIGRLPASRACLATAAVVAIGAIAAGVANAIEDGLGVKAVGAIYVLGAMTAAIGLVPLAVLVNRAGYSRLAGVTAALIVGLLAFVAGGGLLILSALGWLAIVPGVFLQRCPPHSPPEGRCRETGVSTDTAGARALPPSARSVRAAEIV